MFLKPPYTKLYTTKQWIAKQEQISQVVQQIAPLYMHLDKNKSHYKAYTSRYSLQMHEY